MPSTTFNEAHEATHAWERRSVCTAPEREPERETEREPVPGRDERDPEPGRDDVKAPSLRGKLMERCAFGEMIGLRSCPRGCEAKEVRFRRAGCSVSSGRVAAAFNSGGL